jgi:UDP-glucose 4-epimerase
MKGWYNFIAFWIKLALENKPIPIYGTGKQVRDYTYVTDVAKAFLLALENKSALGQTFLLGSKRGVDLNQLSDLIIQYTGSKGGKEYLPLRKGDIQRFVGSYDKAYSLLGWKPEISLEEGLKKEIEWVKSEIK